MLQYVSKYPDWQFNFSCHSLLQGQFKMINKEFMTDRRKAPRQVTSLDIEFVISVTEFGQVRKVETKGTIVDISEQGFGMITAYPLQNGHVITIKGGGKEGIPAYGLVKWISSSDGVYRVGLGYRFAD